MSHSLGDLVCRLAESVEAQVSARAMRVVNSLRLQGLEGLEGSHRAKLLVFDPSWSPKNQVLWGLAHTK